ncbi:MAG: DNA-methyltransferase [Sphingomonadales bacterium]
MLIATGRADVMLWNADALDILPAIPDASIDAVVTDPPYELGFMGRAWDASGIAYNVDLWRHCLRVLKPGGHLLAFGGTRTSHRMTCAIEDAGFEIRDEIAWLYGSGFPKSLDVSKAIDKAAGAEREVIGDKLDRPGYHLVPGSRAGEALGDGVNGHTYEQRLAAAQITAPATDDAKRWQGWGTALKPAHEPIVVARKPLAGTVAANVLAHGIGALNIDGCRIGSAESLIRPAIQRTDNDVLGKGLGVGVQVEPAGRWPTNVVMSHAALIDDDGSPIGDACADGCVPGCPVAELDAQSGITIGSKPSENIDYGAHRQNKKNEVLGSGLHSATPNRAPIGDSGGASRFFPVFRYQAKAPTRERPRTDGVAHPTVKPLELMRWLVRLVTPPGGQVLEPFAGSGTTIEACALEGMRCLAIERDLQYIPLIQDRITRTAS